MGIVRDILTGEQPVEFGRDTRDEYHWLSNQKYRGAEVKQALNDAFVPLLLDGDEAVRGAAVCWFAQNRHKPAGDALLAAWTDHRALFEGQPQPWLPDARDQLQLLEVALSKSNPTAWRAIERERAELAQTAEPANAGTDPRALELGARRAAAEGSLEELRRLVELGALIGRRGEEPTVPPARHAMHSAAQSGRVDVLRWLVGEGARVDCRTGDGFTPLHLAVEAGEVEAAVALVELGANPSMTADDGSTPLSLAHRHARKAELLAALGRKRLGSRHRSPAAPTKGQAAGSRTKGSTRRTGRTCGRPPALDDR